MSHELSVDSSTPAVVLKLDANVMHHGGLGVIRSLGRLGVPVYGVHEGPLAPAAGSRYLHGRWFWQPAQEDTERLRSGLARLADRIGRPAVLIPTDDAGAIFLAEHGDSLRQWFLFPAPPRDIPRRLAGKFSMYQLCRELDVPCPRAAVPGCLEEAREFAATTGFPLVAKLTTPWRRGTRNSAVGNGAASNGAATNGAAKNGAQRSRPGLRSTTIARDPAELEAIYLAGRDTGDDVMLQEFIPGGRGDDWFFHGYCDASSHCGPAFTGIKERSYPAHAGLTSLGRSASNPRLRTEIARLLARLAYRGIVDLDLRFDARDGTYKLLDFNPRLGAQFRLFRDSAGIDVARAQYLDLTAGALPGPAGTAGTGSAGAGGAGDTGHDQVDGRSFLVENYDPISALSYWRGGELGLRDWAASVRGVDETAWFDRDDLRPFGLMCLHMGWHAIRRPLRGQRAHSAARFAAEPRYRRGRGAAKPGGKSPDQGNYEGKLA